jgi:hypothetical protein
MSDFKWIIKLSPQDSISKGQYQEGFLEWEIANAKKVQSALDRTARAIASRAEANLDATENRTGTSFVKVESGDVDRFVTLDDSRSKSPAAAMIEVETEALHRAAGAEAAKLKRAKKARR